MELRIKEIKLLQGNWLTKIWNAIAEAGEYEVKLLFVCSDGIPNDQINMSLNIIPMSEQGVHHFGEHGFALYRSPDGEIPEFIDMHLTVLEDDSGIRSTGELMDAAVSTSAYQGMMETIEKMVSYATVPVVSIASDLFQIAIDVMMKGNKNEIWMQADTTYSKKYGELKNEVFRLSNDRLSVELEIKI